MQRREHTLEDGTTFTVEEVYRDPEGNIYYGFSDPLRMPAQRALAAEVAATWADLNITKDDAIAFCTKMEEFADKGRIGDVIHLVKVLKGRLQWACEDKTLLNLAKVYFLVNDEPIMAPSNEHNALKDKMWDRHGEVRAFFLRRAFVLTKGYSGFSPTDILNYLEVQKAMLARGEGLLQEDASPASTKPSKGASTPSTNSSGSSPGKAPRKSKR